MAYAVRKGIPAREAARDFLEMYQIETDEYDLDSAYRTWQRRKERYLNPTAPVIKTNQKEVSTLQLRGQLALFS